VGALGDGEAEARDVSLKRLVHPLHQLIRLPVGYHVHALFPCDGELLHWVAFLVGAEGTSQQLHVARQPRGAVREGQPRHRLEEAHFGVAPQEELHQSDQQRRIVPFALQIEHE